MFNPEKVVYDNNGVKTKLKDINPMEGFREHCDFKDAPCNFSGHGWYDRCAWCPDVNGFKRKNEK